MLCKVCVCVCACMHGRICVCVWLPDKIFTIKYKIDDQQLQLHTSKENAYILHMEATHVHSPFQLQLVLIEVNNNYKYCIYSYRLVFIVHGMQRATKRKYNYIKILAITICSYTLNCVTLLYKMFQILALFLELQLVKFTKSECWWNYSANPPVQKRPFNLVMVNRQCCNQNKCRC